MIKNCVMCNKEFEAKGRNCSKCCSVECQDELYKRNQEKYRKKRKTKSKNGRPEDQIRSRWANTLCWTCHNATGKCSWSARLEPVKGWKAKAFELKVVVRNKVATYRTSYVVKECPKYIKDS